MGILKDMALDKPIICLMALALLTFASLVRSKSVESVEDKTEKGYASEETTTNAYAPMLVDPQVMCAPYPCCCEMKEAAEKNVEYKGECIGYKDDTDDKDIKSGYCK